MSGKTFVKLWINVPHLIQTAIATVGRESSGRKSNLLLYTRSKRGHTHTVIVIQIALSQALDKHFFML